MLPNALLVGQVGKSQLDLMSLTHLICSLFLNIHKKLSRKVSYWNWKTAITIYLIFSTWSSYWLITRWIMIPLWCLLRELCMVDRNYYCNLEGHYIKSTKLYPSYGYALEIKTFLFSITYFNALWELFFYYHSSMLDQILKLKLFS